MTKHLIFTFAVKPRFSNKTVTIQLIFLTSYEERTVNWIEIELYASTVLNYRAQLYVGWWRHDCVLTLNQREPRTVANQVLDQHTPQNSTNRVLVRTCGRLKYVWLIHLLRCLLTKFDGCVSDVVFVYCVSRLRQGLLLVSALFFINECKHLAKLYSGLFRCSNNDN